MGCLLAILSLASTFEFMGENDASFVEWFFLNPCSVFALPFAVSLGAARKIRNLSASFVFAVPVFFFAAAGMAWFPWNRELLLPQAGHVAMLSSVACLAGMVREFRGKAGKRWIAAGLLLLGTYLFFQGTWIRANPKRARTVAERAGIPADRIPRFLNGSAEPGGR